MPMRLKHLQVHKASVDPNAITLKTPLEHNWLS